MTSTVTVLVALAVTILLVTSITIIVTLWD